MHNSGSRVGEAVSVGPIRLVLARSGRLFDEAVFADSSSVLESEIYPPVEIDVRATLAAAFFNGIVHGFLLASPCARVGLRCVHFPQTRSFTRRYRPAR